MQATLLASRGVLRVVGRDAVSFIHGMTTNRIQFTSTKEAGRYTAFLTQQGRVLLDGFVYPEGPDHKDSVLIDCDASLAATMLEHMRTFKVRVKAQLSDVSDSYAVVQMLPTEPLAKEAPQIPANADLLDRWKQFADAGCLDPRHASLGERLVVRRDRLGAQLADVALATGERVPLTQETDAYVLRRYQLGLPEGAAEIESTEALPFEYNFDYAQGVSMDKGCYLGQELTSRTYFRGVTRKRLMPIKLLPRSITPDRITSDIFQVDKTFAPTEPIIRGKLYRTDTNKSVGQLVGLKHNIGLGMMRWEAFNNWAPGSGEVPTIALAPFDEADPSSESKAAAKTTPPEYLYWAIPYVPHWWPQTNRPEA